MSYDNIDRWVRGITGGPVKMPLKNSNVSYEGDKIYSYGRHFEMARALRDKRGKVEMFLLNGDTYSVSTTRHQNTLRGALRHERAVIIPYEALESAGIVRDSIKVLEVTEDRWEPAERQAREKPHWWDGHGLDTYRNHRNLRETRDWAGPLYQWTDVWGLHRLGESLIRAKVKFAKPEDWSAHYRWATFLSGWDVQESRPLYFLAEMPRSFKGKTVAEAYEALKPEAVVLAEGLGREVKRQGDIFAIPAPSIDRKTLRAKGARFEKRGRVLNTNHVATEVAYLPGGVTMARGCLYHAPDRREPDHARRKISDGWSILQKNTVPTTKRRAA